MRSPPGCAPPAQEDEQSHCRDEPAAPGSPRSRLEAGERNRPKGRERARGMHGARVRRRRRGVRRGRAREQRRARRCRTPRVRRRGYARRACASAGGWLWRPSDDGDDGRCGRPNGGPIRATGARRGRGYVRHGGGGRGGRREACGISRALGAGRGGHAGRLLGGLVVADRRGRLLGRSRREDGVLQLSVAGAMLEAESCWKTDWKVAPLLAAITAIHARNVWGPSNGRYGVPAD
jgi:hypothetical protein